MNIKNHDYQGAPEDEGKTAFRQWMDKHALTVSTVSFTVGVFLIGWGMGNRSAVKKFSAGGWHVSEAESWSPKEGTNLLQVTFRNGASQILTSRKRNES